MKYLTFDFDLGVKVTQFFSFISLYMIIISVQFLAKSVKPLRIYRKMNYLTCDFDLCPWNEGHERKNSSQFLE